MTASPAIDVSTQVGCSRSLLATLSLSLLFLGGRTVPFALGTARHGSCALWPRERELPCSASGSSCMTWVPDVVRARHRRYTLFRLGSGRIRRYEVMEPIKQRRERRSLGLFCL
uniref:Putative secreted protein n=1 Tax=Ixodes ricinus TaxID=34613 RepID=A0A147BEA9_IXORI